MLVATPVLSCEEVKCGARGGASVRRAMPSGLARRRVCCCVVSLMLSAAHARPAVRMSASVAMATATTATGFAHKLLDTAADRAQAAYAAAEDAAAGIKAAHEVKVPDGVAAPHALEPAEAVEPMVPVPIRPHRQKASYDPDRRGNPDAWPPQPPADADATVSYRALY